MSEHGQFGIYIHWPFCAAKCPYCDFNSHVAGEIDQANWAEAYIREIDRVSDETGPRVVSTVFFGGGTPSLMAPETVNAVLGRIRQRWPMANDPEVTLEANPTSVEAARFRGYRDAGVNRVSLGVQALNDGDLRRLGRLHSVREACTALDVAKAIFDRVSFDLIYARQDQSLRDWIAELRRALSMAGDHLSLYQLTIEPGTAFGDRYARGRLSGLPDEDLEADMYSVTQELTGEAGFPAYEVSNHGRVGAESRHNMIYWTGGDYAGIGPGAHGRLSIDGHRIATETWLGPAKWLNSIGQSGTGENHRRILNGDERLAERLMMGLRLADGVPLLEIDTGGRDHNILHKINGLIDIGMLELAQGSVKTTIKGRPVLNAILRELLP